MGLRNMPGGKAVLVNLMKRERAAEDQTGGSGPRVKTA